MQLFGPLHLSLLATIAALCALLAWVCRRSPAAATPLRYTVGTALAVNELGWWVFRYSHEGFRFPRNLPLQLCDVTVWATVIACLTLAPRAVEFDYFAGIADAGMALITPDLWTPWPSYPAFYFFLAHGGIVIGISMLVFGRVVTLKPGAVWRAFGMLVAFALLIGAFNAIFKTNYMYLCTKPGNASLLDSFGPWPGYLIVTAGVALGLFWLLWLPVRPKASAATARSSYAD
jgi:hypothetical integral membrane protein (TIGR02206 family)